MVKECKKWVRIWIKLDSIFRDPTTKVALLISRLELRQDVQGNRNNSRGKKWKNTPRFFAQYAHLGIYLWNRYWKDNWATHKNIRKNNLNSRSCGIQQSSKHSSKKINCLWIKSDRSCSRTFLSVWYQSSVSGFVWAESINTKWETWFKKESPGEKDSDNFWGCDKEGYCEVALVKKEEDAREIIEEQKTKKQVG